MDCKGIEVKIDGMNVLGLQSKKQIMSALWSLSVVICQHLKLYCLNNQACVCVCVCELSLPCV